MGVLSNDFAAVDFREELCYHAQLGLSVQSMVSTDALIKVYDNGKEVISQYAELAAGANSLYFTYAFESAGLHELRFEAEGVGDTLSQNNIYYSYVYSG